MPPLTPPSHASAHSPAGTREPRLWQSIEEIAGEDAQRALLDAMPQLASLLPALSRREFVRLLGAALAMAGLAACKGPPAEVIVPWRRSPDRALGSEPRFYATALDCAGEIAGVLVETHEGRPTKIEGNPAHPASLGATDARMQAAVLELWDPDRSATPTHRGLPAAWSEIFAGVAALRGRIGEDGAGLRVLGGRIASPTLERQRAALLARYPAARWHEYEALDDDHVVRGALIALGVAARPLHRLDRARRIVALDADLLGDMPGHVRHARDFAAGRDPSTLRAQPPRSEDASFNRLYVVEPTPSMTGAVADHRWALESRRIGAFAEALAASLGIEGAIPSSIAGVDPRDIASLADDLRAHRGASLVAVGAAQPPRVHAIAHRINAALGNLGHAVELVPVSPDTTARSSSLRTLVGEMRSGRVDTLLILDGNPVYAAPRELGLADALASVPHAIHIGLYHDETAAACEWHLPRAHALESWSDLRAADGTASIVQPVIAPLHGARSEHEILAALMSDRERDAHAIVRRTWRAHAAGDFETFWSQSLHEGVIRTRGGPARLDAAVVDEWPDAQDAPPSPEALELIVRADPTIWDGRFANSAWLQELPKPLTQLTWSNAALVSPALAAEHGLASGDVVELAVRSRKLRVPVWVFPGQAERSVTLALGYGRTRAGSVGNGRGVDANVLRSGDSPWCSEGLGMRRTGEHVELATTQRHPRMEGRAPVRCASLQTFARDPAFAQHDFAPPPSLYAKAPPSPYAWGMTVDLNACIGCKACTIACQAENNIPTVGAEEVARGREMHWLRVDRYYEGDAAAPVTHHQPVPCMHCEHAPCELVCPVGATVHDSEGLNVQVYNRCIGTRFCSNNCPWKVRRFNFLQYSDLATESLKALRNPDVSVRNRGVMEKCTYCIQRIERAHIAADRESRAIADGEVVTACQAACPTRAISFGNTADTDSDVSRKKRSPRNYMLLGALGTRPRTSYLARLRNPNPAIRGAP